jgi:hypothetical protein
MRNSALICFRLLKWLSCQSKFGACDLERNSETNSRLDVSFFAFFFFLAARVC